MWDRTVSSVIRPRLTAFLRTAKGLLSQERSWERLKDLEEITEPKLGADVFGSDFGFFVIP